MMMKETKDDIEDDMIDVDSIALAMDTSLIKSPTALISIVAHATCHDLHPLETGELGNTTEEKIVVEFEYAFEQIQSQIESLEITTEEAEEAIHFEEMKR